MAKFCGLIGFSATVKTAPGVYRENIITERKYAGDVLQNNRKSQEENGQVNDNIKMSNKFSIVADAYANSNFQEIKYVTFAGTKWKVTNIEVLYPRLILTVGDVYNGK